MSQPTSISFRALCAELVNELHDYKVANEQHDDALVNRVRAALAQPEPQGVGLTDGTRTWLPAAALAQPELEVGEVDELIQCLRTREHFLTQEGASLRDRGDGIYFGRAADMLARYARPVIEPVPVAERPWEREGWCDEAGWCWGFDADDTDPCWVFDRPEAWSCWTHSLPHNALPLPTPLEMNP